MTQRDIFRPITIVLAAALLSVAVLGFVLVPSNAILPVHWGLTGEPDGFMGRNAALLMPLLVTAALLAIFSGLVRFSAPERLEPGRYLMRAVIPALVGLFLVIQVGTVSIGLGLEVSMVRLIALGLGVLLLVMGNMLPKTQPNAHAGIRLPWNLSSPAVWQATHRAGGIVSLAGGLLLIGLALVTGEAPVLLVGVILAMLLPVVVAGLVSYRLSRRP